MPFDAHSGSVLKPNGLLRLLRMTPSLNRSSIYNPGQAVMFFWAAASSHPLYVLMLVISQRNCCPLAQMILSLKLLPNNSSPKTSDYSPSDSTKNNVMALSLLSTAI